MLFKIYDVFLKIMYQFSKWKFGFTGIYFYISLNKNWKIYWSEQSFTGLGPEDRCSSRGLMNRSCWNTCSKRKFWSRTKNTDKIIELLKIWWQVYWPIKNHGAVFLIFFHLLAWKPNLEKISGYSNKFFHNFLTCPNPVFLVPGFRQVG